MFTLLPPLSAINDVNLPEQCIKTCITVVSLELKFNGHMFIMKANPHVCSERQRREERDVVNDVEDDK